MPPKILVAGIGNIFLSDDAFGSEVARQLMRRPHAENIHVFDYGIRGVDLIYALLENYDAAILIDAVPRDGEPPGTLFILEPELNEFHSNAPPMLDAHSLDPVKALTTAVSMGSTIKHVFIVGCQPSELPAEDDLEIPAGLSEPVQAALGAAADMVEELVEKILRQSSVNNKPSEVPLWSR